MPWTRGSTNVSFSDVESNGSVAVAVGANGAIYTTTNGTTWTSRTSNTTETLSWVVWDQANNKWIAGGSTVVVSAPSDGTTWTNHGAPIHGCSGITYSSGSAANLRTKPVLYNGTWLYASGVTYLVLVSATDLSDISSYTLYAYSYAYAHICSFNGSLFNSVTSAGTYKLFETHVGLPVRSGPINSHTYCLIGDKQWTM